MKGLTYDGNPYIDPISGDPESGTGWYEGSGWPGGYNPGDRYYAVSSGPFTLAPGDTQEVVIALFMAIGTDHLNSVTELKHKAVEINHFYGNDYITKIDNDITDKPSEFRLEQNYPNPFNPKTTIEYSIAKPGKVEIIVFDVVGREVAKLVNDTKQAGKYEVVFDGSNYSSGLYLFKMKIGNFIQTRKMLLMK